LRVSPVIDSTTLESGRMSWFRKYAQPTVGTVPTGASPAEGADAQAAPAEGGTAGMRVVFRGDDANNFIVEKLLQPLDSLSQDTWDFLQKANDGNAAARFLTDLADKGQLGNFKQVVESYVTDNIYESVSTGTADGLSQLQEWFSMLGPYLGTADPFGIGDSLAPLTRVSV